MANVFAMLFFKAKIIKSNNVKKKAISFKYLLLYKVKELIINNIYEYNNGLYISVKENNNVFGYSNEELRQELGVKVNKDLYMAYFVIYNTITEFYSDTISSTYAEFVKVEDVIRNTDKALLGIIDKQNGFIKNEGKS